MHFCPNTFVRMHFCPNTFVRALLSEHFCPNTFVRALLIRTLLFEHFCPNTFVRICDVRLFFAELEQPPMSASIMSDYMYCTLHYPYYSCLNHFCLGRLYYDRLCRIHIRQFHLFHNQFDFFIWNFHRFWGLIKGQFTQNLIFQSVGNNR
jgi:hypothetical protein